MTIKPGLYDHFKGHKKAIVLGVGTHTEAHHLSVVYYFEVDADGTLNPQPWARPLDNFTQRIVRNLNGKPTPYDGPRFWRVGTLTDGLKLAGCSLEELFAKLGAEDEVVAPEAIVEEEPVEHIHDASMPGGRLLRRR